MSLRSVAGGSRSETSPVRVRGARADANAGEGGGLEGLLGRHDIPAEGMAQAGGEVVRSRRQPLVVVVAGSPTWTGGWAEGEGRGGRRGENSSCGL